MPWAKRICGIYKIENAVNGKVYIGSAIHIMSRWSIHRSLLNGGKHHSVALQRAWVKYGVDAFSFSIIEELDVDKALLLAREQYWIAQTGAFGVGYNMSPTATNTLGSRRSAEQRARIAAARRKQVRPKQSPETVERRASKLRGQKRTREQCASLSLAKRGKPNLSARGRKMSLEARQKMSEAKKGKPCSEKAMAARRAYSPSAETRAKTSVSSKGRIPSAETRAKISAAKKGWSPTKETRAKMSAAKKGRPLSVITLAAAAVVRKQNCEERRRRKQLLAVGAPAEASL